jgi:hypothetical protein
MEVLFVDDWLRREKEKTSAPLSGVSIWSSWTHAITVHVPALTTTGLLSEGLISVTPLDGGNIKNR